MGSNDDSRWSGFEGARWESGFEPLPSAFDPASVPPPKPPTPRRSRLSRVVSMVLAIVFALSLAVRGAQLEGHFWHPHTSTTPDGAPPLPSAAVQVVPPGMIVYGAPSSFAALRPDRDQGALDLAREICNDQIRPDPKRGHWRCVGWSGMGPADVARTAGYHHSGPCTHRTIGYAAKAWTCMTTVSAPAATTPGPSGNGGPFFADMRDGNDVCVQEARANPTHGAWSCTEWRGFPVGWRYVHPTAPTEPCTFRVADQQTGAWACHPTERW